MSRLAVLLVAASIGGGCVDYLGPGDIGSVRYFGEVRSTPAMPLPVLPPISDREGNAYVLTGSRDLREVQAFTGQAGGGWSSGCSLHKGDDRGAHGWVGRSQDQAWYWSGDALVEVSGETGSCSYVLDKDPATGASIAFLGVVPSVRDAPSRTTVVALIQTPNDPSPFWVVVDLRTRRYTGLARFQPGFASNVVVLGAGATDDAGGGVMLVRYDAGGSSTIEARYVDADGRQIASAQVGGLDTAVEDSVLGFLAVSDGLASGVTFDGKHVVFNEAGGAARAVAGMTASGVHVYDGKLWLVGVSGGRPVVAPLTGDGSMGSVQAWAASDRAQGVLGGSLQVIDDRAAPRRLTKWSNSASAIGAFPFLSAATPHDYAQDTTLWVIAGPSYMAGGELRTQLALSPMGLSYP